MGVPGAGGPVAPGTGTAPIDALPDADEDAESDSDTSAEPANEAGPAAETSADPHTNETVPDAPTTAAPRVEAAPAAEMSAEPRHDVAPDAHPPAMASDTHTGAGENIERSGESPSRSSGPSGSDPDTQ